MDTNIRAEEIRKIVVCVNAFNKPLSISELIHLTGLSDASHIQDLLCIMQEDQSVQIYRMANNEWMVGPFIHSELLVSAAQVTNYITLDDEGVLLVQDEALSPNGFEPPLEPENSYFEFDCTNDSERAKASVKEVFQLTAAEKIDLIRSAAAGDEKALKTVILYYWHHVSVIARFRSRTDFEDLFQVGAKGLLSSILKFDPSKSKNPDQHITAAVNREILDYIEKQRNCIKLSQRVNRAIRKINRAGKKLSRRLEREPSTSELAADTLLSEKKIREVKEYKRVSEVSSPSEPGDAEGQNLAFVDQTSLTFNSVDKTGLSAKCDLLLKGLRDREKLVLYLHYGLDGARARTFEEIGLILSVSRQRIQQIEARAVRKLRTKEVQQFAEDAYDLFSAVKPKKPYHSSFSLPKSHIDVHRTIRSGHTKDLLYFSVLKYIQDQNGYCRFEFLLHFVADQIHLASKVSLPDSLEISLWVVQNLCADGFTRKAFAGDEIVLTNSGLNWLQIFSKVVSHPRFYTGSNKRLRSIEKA